MPIVSGEKEKHCRWLRHEVLPEPKYMEKIDASQNKDSPQPDAEPLMQKLIKDKDSKNQLLAFVEPRLIEPRISNNDPTRIYALIKVNDHYETLEIGTERSVQWAKATYYKETGEFLPDSAYESVLELIKSKVLFGDATKIVSVYTRIAFQNNAIYYDLCNPNWQLLKITASSVVIVTHGINTPMFYRNANQAQQASPNLDFSGDPLSEFCKLMRVETELFKIHILSMFIENIATPIMAPIGQQGSLKSTQSSLVKRVIDPCGNHLEDNLSHFPKTIDDLNIHFYHNYLAAFDNVSYISNKISDALCKAVTGAKYPKRKYYTTSEEINLRFRRKIILNGITVNIDNGDLVERTILYFTKAVPKTERKTERYVEAEFQRILPNVLGQIFTVLGDALKILANVERETTDLPRMADFAVWGEAISRSLGNKEGLFFKIYRNAIDKSNDLLSESDPVLSFVQQEMEGRAELLLPVSSFHDGLRIFAEQHNYDTHSNRFPKSPGKIRGCVEKSKPLLQREGYQIEIYKNTEKNNFTKNSSLIKITKTQESDSSPTSLKQTDGEPGDPSEHTKNNGANTL